QELIFFMGQHGFAPPHPAAGDRFDMGAGDRPRFIQPMAQIERLALRSSSSTPGNLFPRRYGLVLFSVTPAFSFLTHQRPLPRLHGHSISTAADLAMACCLA